MIQFSKRQIAIFHATGYIIHHEGIVNLTTKKIASRVGFTEGALYRHFKGKGEIISGLLLFIKQELDQALCSIDPFLEPETYFKAVFKVLFEFFHYRPHFLSIVFSNLFLSDHKLNTQMSDINNVYSDYLLTSIVQGQKKGLFTNRLSSESFLDIALGTFRLEMFKWLIDPNQPRSIERQLLRMNQLLLLFREQNI